MLAHRVRTAALAGCQVSLLATRAQQCHFPVLRQAVVDASGLELDPLLGEEWPRFRHRIRPEFLQTLPHLHGTAGFFVARLTVR